MGQITADQSQAVMNAITANVHWAEIDFEVSGLQDSAIRDAKEAGRQFMVFLQNGCKLSVEDFFRLTGELTIQIPALPRPTLVDLREKFPWIREGGGIERDSSPIEALTLTLATVLRVDEKKPIGGLEYERRLTPKLDTCLGYQQAVWLIEHQDEFPEFMALLGKIYIDFPGLVVVSSDGDRHYPYLSRDDRRWYLYWHWIDDSFGSYSRIAISRK